MTLRNLKYKRGVVATEISTKTVRNIVNIKIGHHWLHSLYWRNIRVSLNTILWAGIICIPLICSEHDCWSNVVERANIDIRTGLTGISSVHSQCLHSNHYFSVVQMYEEHRIVMLELWIRSDESVDEWVVIVVSEPDLILLNTFSVFLMTLTAQSCSLITLLKQHNPSCRRSSFQVVHLTQQNSVSKYQSWLTGS